MPLRVSCPGPLLRVACLGGGGLAPVPPYLAWGCCCEGHLRSGAPPPPTARPLGGLLGSATHVLWARMCGCGGPTLSPWPACPVGAACRGGGVVGGRPRGGVACHCCEGRLVSGNFPPPTARPLGRAAGVPGPVCSGCGRCGRGDPAPAPQLAPLWAGDARRGGGGIASPGGGSVCRCEGSLGSGAPPPPAARPLDGLPGPTTHWLWVRGGCGRRDPSPTPQRALLRAGFARCRGGTRAPGGGASCLGVGRPGSGALPTPTARPLGGLPGPTTHWLWVRGDAGVGTRHQPHSARSCVLWGRHEGPRGGGASRLGVGRPGSGALPPPTARPLGGLLGPTTHWLWVRGGAGLGTRHQPHSARSCEMA